MLRAASTSIATSETQPIRRCSQTAARAKPPHLVAASGDAIVEGLPPPVTDLAMARPARLRVWMASAAGAD